jgi:hypothetical protein
MPTTREASDWLTVSSGAVAAKLSSLALGGAAIGSHKLAWTGTAQGSGQLILPAGSVGTPSVNFGTVGQGIYAVTSSVIGFTQGSALVVSIADGQAWVRSDTGSFGIGASFDVVATRDAANVWGFRNGTSSQSLNWYDSWASATDYHRGALKTARATLSNVSGASVTASGIIPDGAVVVGVTTKVTTGLGTTLGTTGYTVGDGTDVDRWGAITGTAAGTSSDNRDWTATTVQAFTAASDIVITATGGNFDATGVIYVSVQYLIGQAD